MKTTAAYRQCERTVRQQRYDFSQGLSSLPRKAARAGSAIHAFAGKLSDIDTAVTELPAKLEEFAHLSYGLGASFDQDDPLLVAVHDAINRYELPVTLFHDMVDAHKTNVQGIKYVNFAQLHDYCAQTTGAVFQLILRTIDDNAGQSHADQASALGVALHLTAIIRDVLEDRRNGRVYLPLEDLERFGCSLELGIAGNLTDNEEALHALLVYQGIRAEEWYEKGQGVLHSLTRKNRTYLATVIALYRRLLDRMITRPWMVRQGKVSLPHWERAAANLGSRTMMRGHRETHEDLDATDPDNEL